MDIAQETEFSAKIDEIVKIKLLVAGNIFGDIRDQSNNILLLKAFFLIFVCFIKNANFLFKNNVLLLSKILLMVAIIQAYKNKHIKSFSARRNNIHDKIIEI